MRLYAVMILVCAVGCKGSSTSGQDGGGGGGGMVSSAIMAVATCQDAIADGSGNGDAGAANRTSYGDTPGAFGTRVRYPGNGLAAEVVYENVTAAEHQLLATDESGDCSSRPAVRLDATPAVQHLVPR